MMNDNDDPDREEPTTPPSAPIKAIEIEPTEPTEPTPDLEASSPPEPDPLRLPHEDDPEYVYDTAAWPEGDYKGEPHPWQTTTR